MGLWRGLGSRHWAVVGYCLFVCLFVRNDRSSTDRRARLSSSTRHGKRAPLECPQSTPGVPIEHPWQHLRRSLRLLIGASSVRLCVCSFGCVFLCGVLVCLSIDLVSFFFALFLCLCVCECVCVCLFPCAGVVTASTSSLSTKSSRSISQPPTRCVCVHVRAWVVRVFCSRLCAPIVAVEVCGGAYKCTNGFTDSHLRRFPLRPFPLRLLPLCAMRLPGGDRKGRRGRVQVATPSSFGRHCILFVCLVAPFPTRVCSFPCSSAAAYGRTWP